MPKHPLETICFKAAGMKSLLLSSIIDTSRSSLDCSSRPIFRLLNSFRMREHLFVEVLRYFACEIDGHVDDFLRS